MRQLGISGVWVMEPEIHADERGTFNEWFRDSGFRAAVGASFDLAQANCSTSRRGVIRGVHFADVPPGQAKYITCVAGAVLDVVVDVRVGSETFGRWESVVLDDEHRRAVYVAEGVGHAFMALSDPATVVYLCSREYAPAREHAVHALDPALRIAWPAAYEPVMSEKDARAPMLEDARTDGLLPRFDACATVSAVSRQRDASGTADMTGTASASASRQPRGGSPPDSRQRR